MVGTEINANKGDEGRDGIYKVTTTGIYSKEPIEIDARFLMPECYAKIIDLDKQIESSKNSALKEIGKAPTVVKIGKLINQFDNFDFYEKVYMQIYSDSADLIFNSNEYEFDSVFTMFDHENLMVPCEK